MVTPLSLYSVFHFFGDAINRIEVVLSIVHGWLGKVSDLSRVYCDKSPLIAEIIHGARVTLLPRPRRFGKTLNMSMLSYFFSNAQDYRYLFDGLAIARSILFCALSPSKVCLSCSLAHWFFRFTLLGGRLYWLVVFATWAFKSAPWRTVLVRRLSKSRVARR